MPTTKRLLIALALVLCCTCVRAQTAFYLKPHDRVVFYGDSITDDGRYARDIENYAVTRFPKLDVTFIPAGVGGDRVTGGWMGSIDERLRRDVIPYHPTVMTIMLGMNDGAYRAYDQSIFDTYASGYRKILADMKQADPGLRFTLIQPSPFDDVTRPPLFPGGYNAVLVRYGEFVRQLAGETGCTVVDMNSPLVSALEKAKAIDPTVAATIIKDRVHPGAGGHWIMAEAMLKAWNAPSVVSDVSIDAATRRVVLSDGARVSELAASADGASWTETDRSLPLWFDTSEPTVALVLKSSDLAASLNRERLTVTGLDGSAYALKIDGKAVGTFSGADLAKGIDLSALDTPMMAQSREVANLTELEHTAFYARWRQVMWPFHDDQSPALQRALDALAGLEASVVRQQHAAAQPKPHRYEIVPAA